MRTYLTRSLRDPDPVDGGGGPETPPAKPPASQGQQQPPPEPPKPEPAPEPPNPKPPAAITLTPEQFERFKQMEREAEQLRTEKAKREEAERKEAEKRLIEEGKLREVITSKDAELAKRDAKLAETEDRSKRWARDKEIAVALADQPLVPGAAAQLSRLFRDDFETVPDGESWKVQARDGKPVAEYIRERLATPEYAHFVPADKRGGSGATASGQQPAPEPARPDPARDLFDRVKQSFNRVYGDSPAPLGLRLNTKN